MWKTHERADFAGIFCPQPHCVKSTVFQQRENAKILKKVVHRNSIHIPQGLWNKIFYFLQAGIDIGCNIPDVLLQVLIAGIEGVGDFIDGIKYSGMVLV